MRISRRKSDYKATIDFFGNVERLGSTFLFFLVDNRDWDRRQKLISTIARIQNYIVDRS